MLDQLAFETRKDGVTSAILEAIESGRTPDDPVIARNISDCTTHVELVLIRGRGGLLRIFVPLVARPRILENCHGGSALSGHQSRTRTLDIIQRNHWWPGMSQDVARWVGSCPRCLAAKTPLNKTVGIARFSRAAQHPFDIVAMDFVGPLPETPSGNKFLLT